MRGRRCRPAPLWLAPLLLAALLSLAMLAVLPADAPAAEPAPFAITRFTLQTTRASVANPFLNEPYSFTQAGGHPFALSTRIEFASEPFGGRPVPTQDPRDVAIDLPPGLLADPHAVTACRPGASACPVDSQVGSIVLRMSRRSLLEPLYNVVPGNGTTPAELAVPTPIGLVPFEGRLVRAARGYALSVVASGLVELGILGIEITLWGVPADGAHDPLRGRSCTGTLTNLEENCGGGGLSSGEAANPFLTMPSDCESQPPTATAWSDSWQEPGRYVQAASTGLAALESCDSSPFSPQLTLQPDSLQAEAPVAVALTLTEPQTAIGVSAPPLRRATITLPQGMSLNPAAAAGAQGCAAFGPEGIDLPTGLGPHGAPIGPGEVGEGEETGPEGESLLAAGHCPPASTIGDAEAQSPLFAGTLSGRVYLAAPACGASAPCSNQDAADGGLYRVYVELGGVGGGVGSTPGVVIKLAGEILANPTTGQLTLELLESPQLPLRTLQLELFGGTRALLVNPGACGPASTSSDLESWSAPRAPDASPSSHYLVGGCLRSQPFVPALVAGSANVAAGAFTTFLAEVSRQQGEQQLGALQLRAPVGVAAMLAAVSPCPERLASAGACLQTARVGDSTVAVGSGSQPLHLSGQVYLTGPYEGAPFGLAIVTHALAGPLDLGQIVIRARLELDPRTAALVVTTDPLPQIVLGVPLRLRELRLDVDRPGFIVNPTDCRGQDVRASVASAQGTLVALSNPFALAGCAALSFTPRLTAATGAATSVRDGASLDVRLGQATGPGSGQANLARLRIALPRTLPTRLTALQGSCRERTFAVNPAACPAASVIGIARAATPLLSAPLLGPVYMVARGRGAFPAPTIVLQGKGLRLELIGSTDVERSGRTAISFAALPDLPLRSFELYLPRGPHSALTAAGDLCSSARMVRGGVAASLPLPVELFAHNGRVLHRGARIAVVGCPHPRPRAHAARHTTTKRNHT